MSLTELKPMSFSKIERKLANRLVEDELKWNECEIMSVVVLTWSGAISIQGLSVFLQSVHHVHGGHGFPRACLRVHNGVSGDSDKHTVAELPHGCVGGIGNPLDSSSSGQSSQSSFGHLVFDALGGFLDDSFRLALFSCFAHFAFPCHFGFCLNLIIWLIDNLPINRQK